VLKHKSAPQAIAYGRTKNSNFTITQSTKF